MLQTPLSKNTLCLLDVSKQPWIATVKEWKVAIIFIVKRFRNLTHQMVCHTWEFLIVSKNNGQMIGWYICISTSESLNMFATEKSIRVLLLLQWRKKEILSISHLTAIAASSQLPWQIYFNQEIISFTLSMNIVKESHHIVLYLGELSLWIIKLGQSIIVHLRPTSYKGLTDVNLLESKFKARYHLLLLMHWKYY